MQEKFAFLCCTVSLTSRIAMWRRQFCNTWRWWDSEGAARLYRLPGRITQQPGFFATTGYNVTHPRTAMGPWPAVSGAWVTQHVFLSMELLVPVLNIPRTRSRKLRVSISLHGHIKLILPLPAVPGGLCRWLHRWVGWSWNTSSLTQMPVFRQYFLLMKMSRLAICSSHEKQRDAISSQGPSPQIPPQAALAQADVPLRC